MARKAQQLSRFFIGQLSRLSVLLSDASDNCWQRLAKIRGKFWPFSTSAPAEVVTDCHRSATRTATRKKLDSWFQWIEKVMPLVLVVVAVIVAATEMALGIDIALVHLPWYSGFLLVATITVVLVAVAILDTILYDPWGKRRRK